MTPVELTLIGRPGCHLCEDARAAIAGVLASPAIAGADISVRVRELSLLDDPELLARYADDIPVVLINDRQHTFWRVDPARLTAALQKASTAA